MICDDGVSHRAHTEPYLSNCVASCLPQEVELRRHAHPSAARRRWAPTRSLRRPVHPVHPQRNSFNLGTTHPRLFVPRMRAWVSFLGISPCVFLNSRSAAIFLSPSFSPCSRRCRSGAHNGSDRPMGHHRHNRPLTLRAHTAFVRAKLNPRRQIRRSVNARRCRDSRFTQGP